ncbi:MAG: HEAT repeat domain-containing protein [Planctomycetales bacterium]|nr:HEAT repeat domain-containing protein [Planctomycetales bacterium]
MSRGVGVAPALLLLGSGLVASPVPARAQDPAPAPAGDPAAAEAAALEKALEALKKALASRMDPDIARACEELGATRSPKAIPRLAPLVSDPRDVVALGALRGIRAVGGAPAAEALLALERGLEKRPPVRVEAIAGLGALKERRALATLQDLVQDPKVPVAAAAIVALGEIPDRSSIEILLKHWEGLSGTVRFAPGAKKQASPNQARLDALQNTIKDALGAITGKKDLSTLEAWKDWWKANKATFRVPAPGETAAPAAAADPPPPAAPGGAPPAPAVPKPAPKPASKTPARAASPEEEAKFGRERTEPIPLAAPLGAPLAARETPWCIVALAGGKPADREAAKSLGAIARQVEAAIRARVPLPPDEDENLLKTVVLVVAPGPQAAAVLAAAGLAPADAEAAARRLAAAGVWWRRTEDPLVLVERRPGEAVGTGAHGGRLAHALAHAFLPRVSRWAVEGFPAWLDEGFACAADAAALPGASHSCVLAEARADFAERARWAETLVPLARASSDPPLAGLFARALPADLGGAEAAKATSFVSWLLETRREKLRALVNNLTATRSPEAFPEALGETADALDAAWRAWVQR